MLKSCHFSGISIFTCRLISNNTPPNIPPAEAPDAHISAGKRVLFFLNHILDAPIHQSKLHQSILVGDFTTYSTIVPSSAVTAIVTSDERFIALPLSTEEVALSEIVKVGTKFSKHLHSL